ncbi:MAG: hypothetical protein JOZ43_05615 [Acidobacteriales bacterium]|nr:hypothetical protein [Terriglobales bacterium]
MATKKPRQDFESEGEAQELEFTDRDDRQFWAAQDGSDQEFDETEDISALEVATERDTGRRMTGARVVGDPTESLEDLQREAQSQTGGTRGAQHTTLQGKQSTSSKSRTSQPSPKRSNPVTHDLRGAAEKRSGNADQQGITGHTVHDEDQRQSKVVSIRNDAKAAGHRTGSRNKAS